MKKLRDLEDVKVFLEVAQLLAKKPKVNCWEFHPLAIADMMANLDNPCTITDFIEVLVIFIEEQIKFLGESENE